MRIFFCFQPGGLPDEYAAVYRLRNCAGNAFLPNGQLDEPALRRLLFMQLEAKIDALVLLGTTGEPCTLSMDERQRVMKIGLECMATPSP